MAVKLLARKDTLRPERQDLSAAIAYHVERQTQIEAIRAALETAQRVYHEALERCEVAEGNVEKAKVAAPKHLVDIALGRPTEPQTSIREANNALAEAQDHLAACRATKDSLQVERSKLEFSAGIIADRVREEAIKVLGRAPAIPVLLADLERLQRETLDKALQLRWLVDTGAIPRAKPGSPEAADRLVQELDHRLPRAVYNYLPSWQALVGSVAGAAKWEAALAALLTNADAEIPR